MRISILAAVLLLTTLPGAGSAQGHPHAPARPGARAAVDSFTAALQRGDSARVLRLLHPDLVVYESGVVENLAQYRSHHLAADISFLAAVSSTTLHDRITVTSEMALYTREYRSRGTWHGRAIDSVGTETLVLVPGSQGWRIRHIHWSSRD